ncbi:cell division cycle 7-related protein kinase [Drosophila subobscura]|uniref:cell division cycle 7-related protein kinase n=1 Tax=Drosophila subobscura TaxID=7241 RepID=UPI00155ADDCF|nr:cell division cycle 7-related protein kinase [Drosophila subobscura]XP_034671294.1 cell division cycle 7-related protein kinase [Drosophila subobscura]
MAEQRFIKHEPMAVHQQHVQHAQHVRKSKPNTIQFYAGTSPIVLVSNASGGGAGARQAARLDTPTKVRNAVTKHIQKQLNHHFNINESGPVAKPAPSQQPLAEQHNRPAQPNAEQNGTPIAEQQLPSATEEAGAMGAVETATATKAEVDVATGARLMKLRNKSEDAITDLLTRIPDVGHLFDVQSRIGNGTFSTVLLATLKREANLPESMRRKFAIKHHIPTSHPDRIMKELQCMTKMGGMDNVVGIHCCMRCDASAAFVMPYMPHDRFHDFYTKMDVSEIRLYMRNLLVALRHVHKFNVIHRDVKPSNFLYNRRRREFLLVDFGLAQHVNPPVLAAGTAAGGQQEQRSRHTAAGGPNSKRFRDRETEAAVQTTAAAAAAASAAAVAAADAGLGGAVKRMRLNEEGGWGKMPLKPVNEIAHGQNESKEVVAQAPEQPQLSTQQQQQQQQPEQTPSSATGTGTGTGTVACTGSKYNTNRSATGSTNSGKCFCFANPSVCLNCLMKKEVHASRAGTPGYRPPEVLLKYADQTTAVDVWSVGVIFLSLMSSVYPFFKAPNDYIALAEIVTIFGDQEIRKTALALERMVTLSQRSRPLNLRKLCLRFRNRAIFSDAKMLKKYESPDGQCEVCKNCDQYFFNCLCEESEYLTEPLEPYEVFPASAYDLLERLLEVNPHKRITAAEALQHSFFNCQGQGQNSQTAGAQQVASAPRKGRTAAARQMTRRRVTTKSVSMGIQPLQQLEIEQQLLYPAKLEELQTVLNKL